MGNNTTIQKNIKGSRNTISLLGRCIPFPAYSVFIAFNNPSGDNFLYQLYKKHNKKKQNGKI